MSEYIEREALFRRISKKFTDVLYRGHEDMVTRKESCNPTEWTRGYEKGTADAISIMMQIPTADVVEVVRCRECKHCEMCFPCKGFGLEAPPVYVCCVGHRNREVLPTDYCSYGEAKMDGKGDTR